MNTFNPIAYPLSFSDNPQCDRLECSNLVLLPPEILQNIRWIGFLKIKRICLHSLI